MATLKIRDVSFTYPNEDTPALENLSVDIEKGEFVVLIGQSGCGKSTVLRHIKRELKPHGQMTGTIYYQDCPVEELEDEIAASEIGFVLQDPENQIVTDKVWHELAFGLENMGLDTQVIRRRVAEMANFFGIQKWFHQKTTELSGGQKQLLNLASVMVMQPKILLLDEPTSQLDPIAAMEFIQTLRRLNEELGITIICIEHRLEEVLPIADRVLVMEEGRLIFDGPPKQVLFGLPRAHPILSGLPTAMQLFRILEGEGEAPLTIREGQRWLEKHWEPTNVELSDDSLSEETPIIMEVKDVAFRYEKSGLDIVKHFNLRVRKGEFFTMIGGNGTGKSTALSILAGLNKPYRGKVSLLGKKLDKFKLGELYKKYLTLLPQDPKTLFVEKSVRQELEEMAKLQNVSEEKVQEKIEQFQLSHLLNRHPYDLSGGEQQKLALAKVLLVNPKILLLDEPTKGLDAYAKAELGQLLLNLQAMGVTIIMVTHDIEFSARYSSRCGLFFDGNIVSESNPRTFYSGNNFYTTAAHRLTRGIRTDVIIYEDVALLCQKNFV